MSIDIIERPYYYADMVKSILPVTPKAERTRQHILAEGLLMATEKSLNEVTIGELAKAAKLSKSGLFAHFQSKENLQIAIINYASQIFTERVIKSVNENLSPIEKLQSLANNWLDWYEGSAKSCIFMTGTMEFDGKPGQVRNALHNQIHRWIKFLEIKTQQAANEQELMQNTDPKQFVFELYSLFLGSQKYLWIEKENENRKFFNRGLRHLIQQYSN